MTWAHFLGYAALAIIFGGAASAKARHFTAFVAYLTVPFNRSAHAVASAVIGGEGVLAVGLVGGWASLVVADKVLLAAAIFLLAATLFISCRLLLAESTVCACWGANQRIHDEDVRANAFRPAWYGLRNGVLLLSVWVLFESPTSQGVGLSVNSSRGLAIFAICPIIIAVGLGVSIAMNWHYLTREQHPLRNVLAPRLAPLVALSWYTGSTYAPPIRQGRVSGVSLADAEAKFAASIEPS